MTSNHFFKVEHNFNAYLELWTKDSLPSADEIMEMQPFALKLLSESKTLEQQSLERLKVFDKNSEELINYLKIQTQKVDLILQHILENSDTPGDKYCGTKFGGSHLQIKANKALDTNTKYKTTIYINDTSTSILCITNVISSEQFATDYLIELEIIAIRTEDVEQLVKASLNIQQQQLQSKLKI